MPRGLTEKGDQIRAFAREKGVTPRTARMYRKDPKTGEPRAEWLEWLAGGGHQGAAAKVEPDAPRRSSVREEWERAVEARETAWENLRRLQERMKSVSSEELPALARACREQRRAWQDACNHAREAEVAAGRLISRDVLAEVERALVVPLNDAFRALRNQVASQLPVNVRAQFYNAWKRSQKGWERGVAAIDMRIKDLLG